MDTCINCECVCWVIVGAVVVSWVCAYVCQRAAVHCVNAGVYKKELGALCLTVTKRPATVRPGNVPKYSLCSSILEGPSALCGSDELIKNIIGLQPHCWVKCPGCAFDVRQPSYWMDGLKASSIDSLYDVFAVSTWSSSHKLPHIGRVAELPYDEDVVRLGLPSCIIVNVMLPLYSPPGILGRVMTDGPSWQLTVYCRLSNAVRAAIIDGRAPPAVDLLRRFMHPVDGVGIRKERLKIVLGVVDVHAPGFGVIMKSIVKSYNYKPFLSTTASSFFLTKVYIRCPRVSVPCLCVIRGL